MARPKLIDKSLPREPGMIHANGNILCVVDVESTGLDIDRHEIIDICVLPLDRFLRPSEIVLPFHMRLKPYNMDIIDHEALRVNHKTLQEICQSGADADEAADLLCRWFEEMQLPFNKRIIPLGHNYQNFDKWMIRRWLGPKMYDHIFHYHVRDTMTAALYINDRCFFNGEKLPFIDVTLAKICSQLKIHRERKHDALQDAMATAEAYRLMMTTITGPLVDVMDEPDLSQAPFKE